MRMQSEGIVSKVKLFKSHKKTHGGDYWYTKPGSIRYTLAEIYQCFKNGIEFEFLNGVEEVELLAILAIGDKGGVSGEKIDKSKQGDKELMKRIILAGGFCAYIENLEGKIK
jgi:hypothetical protein